MTKADQIRALYATGRLSTSEIAERVGCRVEYVRVCARQRKGGRASEIDRRYLGSDLGRTSRMLRETDPIRAEPRKAYYRSLYETCDKARAQRKGAEAHRLAIALGASPAKAHTARTNARQIEIRRTGDRAKAREAYHQAKLQLQAFHVKNQESQHGQQAEA
jgi:hypothetical protein